MTDPKNTTHERKTLVEEGTQFKGALSSNCPIEVKGRIEGDVTAPALSVALGGAVHGKVKVGEIRSQGELAGEFDADTVVLSGHDQGQHRHPREVARGEADLDEQQDAGDLRRVRARGRRRPAAGRRGRAPLGASQDDERPAQRRERAAPRNERRALEHFSSSSFGPVSVLVVLAVLEYGCAPRAPIRTRST